MDARSRELKEPLLDDTELTDMELGQADNRMVLAQAESKEMSKKTSYYIINSFLHKAPHRGRQTWLHVSICLNVLFVLFAELFINTLHSRPSRSSVYPWIGLPIGLSLLPGLPLLFAFLTDLLAKIFCVEHPSWGFTKSAIRSLDATWQISDALPDAIIGVNKSEKEFGELNQACAMLGINISKYMRVGDLRKRLDQSHVGRSIQCSEVFLQGLFKDQGSELNKLSSNRLFSKDVVPLIFDFAGLRIESPAENKSEEKKRPR